MIVDTDSGAFIGFFSLKMCRLPFPLVDTFFSDAGALYLVLRNRALRLWISCLDCFPPPLFCCMVDEADAPDPPLDVLLPVQLLHKISPWFPFFHIDEEFVLHTAQHGFKPSGMLAEHKKPASTLMLCILSIQCIKRNGDGSENNFCSTTKLTSLNQVNL